MLAHLPPTPDPPPEPLEDELPEELVPIIEPPQPRSPRRSAPRTLHSPRKAIAVGNLTVIGMLLDHGARLEFASPLHTALRKLKKWEETKQVLELLLLRGANIEQCEEELVDAVVYATKPLALAIKLERWEAAEYLLKKGAQP